MSSVTLNTLLTAPIKLKPVEEKLIFFGKQIKWKRKSRSLSSFYYWAHRDEKCWWCSYALGTWAVSRRGGIVAMHVSWSLGSARRNVWSSHHHAWLLQRETAAVIRRSKGKSILGGWDIPTTVTAALVRSHVCQSQRPGASNLKETRLQ